MCRHAHEGRRHRDDRGSHHRALRRDHRGHRDRHHRGGHDHPGHGPDARPDGARLHGRASCPGWGVGHRDAVHPDGDRPDRPGCRGCRPDVACPATTQTGCCPDAVIRRGLRHARRGLHGHHGRAARHHGPCARHEAAHGPCPARTRTGCCPASAPACHRVAGPPCAGQELLASRPWGAVRTGLPPQPRRNARPASVLPGRPLLACSAPVPRPPVCSPRGRAWLLLRRPRGLPAGRVPPGRPAWPDQARPDQGWPGPAWRHPAWGRWGCCRPGARRTWPSPSRGQCSWRCRPSWPPPGDFHESCGPRGARWSTMPTGRTLPAPSGGRAALCSQPRAP